MPMPPRAIVALRPLTLDDIDAHNAGEDEKTIRWLTGARSTVETTRRHIEMLAGNGARGTGKRGYGVLLDGVLAGSIDFDPDAEDGLAPGDVTIAYAVHPWARGRGVASAAVGIICDRLSTARAGQRAVIRADVLNPASAAVARANGFAYLGDFPAPGERRASGEQVVYAVFALGLG